MHFFLGSARCLNYFCLCSFCLSKKLEYFKRSKKGRGITQLKNIISSNRSAMLFFTFMAISHYNED